MNEFERMRNGINELDRLLSEMAPSWPEALVNLIDALRDFIRSEDETAEDLWIEGSITRAQYDGWQKDRKRYVAMLKRLERYDIDPSLNGLREQQ